jgi:nucleoside-diphosphate-sugar epimerase
MAADAPVLLTLGHGYVANSLAAAWIARGGTVVATSRSPQTRARLGAAGLQAIEPLPDALRSVRARVGAIVCSVPPDAEGCPGWRALQAAGGPIAGVWMAVFSTTGVYGDRGGGWAFEEDSPAPGSPEAATRLVQERQWQSVGAEVLRLPGIYGPGRSALDRVRAGDARRIVRQGQVFSRIHVDDIVAAVLACRAAPQPGRAINVADDAPSDPGDPLIEAARLLGAAPPPAIAFEAADLSPMARRFYAESRRVSNARLKAATGWRPAYPSWREGLQAILAQEIGAPAPLPQGTA